MTLNEIQNLTGPDLDRLSKTELQKIVQYNKQVLIKRYKAQKSKMGEVAPIYKDKGNPYRIKTTNLTRNKLIEAVKTTTSTTKAQTSTVSGFKQWIKHQEKALGEKYLTEKQLKKIWDLYDKLEELHPDLFSKVAYKKILKQITDIVTKNKYVGYKAVEKKIKEYTASQSAELKEWVNKNWEGIVDTNEMGEG